MSSSFCSHCISEASKMTSNMPLMTGDETSDVDAAAAASNERVDKGEKKEDNNIIKYYGDNNDKEILISSSLLLPEIETQFHVNDDDTTTTNNATIIAAATNNDEAAVATAATTAAMFIDGIRKECTTTTTTGGFKKNDEVIFVTNSFTTTATSTGAYNGGGGGLSSSEEELLYALQQSPPPPPPPLPSSPPPLPPPPPPPPSSPTSFNFTTKNNNEAKEEEKVREFVTAPFSTTTTTTAANIHDARNIINLKRKNYQVSESGDYDIDESTTTMTTIPYPPVKKIKLSTEIMTEIIVDYIACCNFMVQMTEFYDMDPRRVYGVLKCPTHVSEYIRNSIFAISRFFSYENHTEYQRHNIRALMESCNIWICNENGDYIFVVPLREYEEEFLYRVGIIVKGSSYYSDVLTYNDLALVSETIKP